MAVRCLSTRIRIRGCPESLCPVRIVISRQLKKSASGVLASLRGSTYQSVRLASSLAAALLDGLFEQPVWCAQSVFPQQLTGERMLPLKAGLIPVVSQLVDRALQLRARLRLSRA